MGTISTTIIFTFIITFSFINAEYLFYYSYDYFSPLLDISPSSSARMYGLANSTDVGILHHCPTSGYLYPQNYNGVFDHQTHNFYTLFKPSTLFSYNVVSEESQRLTLTSTTFDFTTVNAICRSARTSTLYVLVNTLKYTWNGFIATIDTKTGILTRVSANYIVKTARTNALPDQCVVDDVNNRIVWRVHNYTFFTTDLRVTNDGATTDFEKIINLWLYYSPTDGKLYASVATQPPPNAPPPQNISIVSLTISGNNFTTKQICSTTMKGYSSTGSFNLDKKVISFIGAGYITEININDGKESKLPLKWDPDLYYNGDIVSESIVWYSLQNSLAAKHTVSVV